LELGVQLHPFAAGKRRIFPVLQEPSLDAEELVADPAAARTAVQRRVRRIAEQAFWDSQAQVGRLSECSCSP